MSMVWPCPLTVDVYVSLGRAVKVPRPRVPVLLAAGGVLVGLLAACPLAGAGGEDLLPRVRCRGCGVTHAMLPAFVLARRLDAAESAGAVIGQVAAGASGVRPAAAAAGVPYTTARGWAAGSPGGPPELAVSSRPCALSWGRWSGRTRAAGSGGLPGRSARRSRRRRPCRGVAVLGAWRFASAVTGGSLLAANASSPWMIIGSRRFMPPRSP